MYELDHQEINEIVKILKSKQLFRYHGKGKRGVCDHFEEEFSHYLGQKYSILLSSGTNALISSLVSAKIGVGDEVIIPAYTFAATAFAVLYVGATPIVVNIDKTLTIDIEEIKKHITNKTKAIIPVHIDGLACNMEKILNLCKEKKLTLIEDAAQAIGGEYKGKKLGSFGDFGCFSLNVDKIISTGEGGILTTNSTDLYKRAFCYHDPVCQFGPTKQDEMKDIKFAGASMRVSEITGVLASVQLKKLDLILQTLRNTKKIILNHLRPLASTHEIILPHGYCLEGDCSTSLHITFSNTKSLLAVTKKLLESRIPAHPLSMRLGHFVWNWGDLLYSSKRSAYEPKNKLDYKYNKFFFINTIDIVSHTIRIEIPYALNEQESHNFAENILKTVREFT